MELCRPWDFMLLPTENKIIMLFLQILDPTFGCLKDMAGSCFLLIMNDAKWPTYFLKQTWKKSFNLKIPLKWFSLQTWKISSTLTIKIPYERSILHPHQPTNRNRGESVRPTQRRPWRERRHLKYGKLLNSSEVKSTAKAKVALNSTGQNQSSTLLFGWF